MPLTINVGLSRKASKDYQSTGLSVNLVAELDQSLLARPEELQQQIHDLYAQAERAMDRQAAQGASSPRPRNTPNGRNDNGYARNGNGRNGRDGNAGGHGVMTESQRRAISSIATRLNVDPEVEAREIIGAELDRLSLRQASELIDHLKGLQESGNGHG